MLFWILTGVVSVLVAGALALPLLRPRAAPEEQSSDVALYRDQLAEVARDLERGTLAPDEAERSRIEISRRILAADGRGGPPARQAPEGATRLAVALAGALVILGGIAGYYRLGAPGYPDLSLASRIAQGDAVRDHRPGQAEAEAAAAQLPRPEVEAPADYLAMVQQLRDIVPTRPDDQQGWTLLARHEGALRNYAAAAAAQAHLVEIRGDDATVGDLQLLADFMVAATAGQVSPEAEQVVRRIIARDDQNLAARYYLGLLYAETDRPDIAFRLWRGLVDSGQGGIHVELARAQIEDAAMRAGVNYTLPEAPGPSAADIEAAGDMTAADREAMIRGMVDGLAQRLASQGGPVEDWARLITSLATLGETDQAGAILAEARQVFAASAAAMAQLDAAAASAGLSP